MKKFMSFILVIVMVLSGVVIGFADAENLQISDYDQIKYKQAAEIMLDTGIYSGYPDGNFYPRKSVTRGEMAKIITLIANGGKDLRDESAEACQFSDAQGHWASAYIQYCVDRGILSGKDSDTFAPNIPVSGLEAAKMLLVLLGYDAVIEGFIGTNTRSNIMRVASENSLFYFFEENNPTGTITRETAAQMILNALNAQTVEYRYGAQVSVDHPSVTITTTVEKTGITLYEKYFITTK